MKYAVNHPYMFTAQVPLQGNKDAPGDKMLTAMTRRTFLAFMLGFFQVTVSIIVESLVIYYLSSLDDLMKIIIEFVSLAKIVKFDDMYAKSLYENAIKNVKGK